MYNFVLEYDTGDKVLVKVHKKINIGILEIMNLKLIKFWGYNEKNMSFLLTPENVPIPVELGKRRFAMGTCHFQVFKRNFKWPTCSKLQNGSHDIALHWVPWRDHIL